MMRADYVEGFPQAFLQWNTYLVTRFRMSLHDFSFLGRKWTGFIQNGIRNVDFTYIVQNASEFEGLQFLCGQPHFGAQRMRQVCNPLNMALSINIAGFDSVCQRDEQSLDIGQIVIKVFYSEQRFGSRQEFLPIRRFDYEFVCPGFYPFEFRILPAERRQHDYRNQARRIMGFQSAADLKTIHVPRHHGIQKDQIYRRFIDHVQCFFTIDGLKYLIIKRQQECFQHLTADGFVVDHQDPWTGLLHYGLRLFVKMNTVFASGLCVSQSLLCLQDQAGRSRLRAARSQPYAHRGLASGHFCHGPAQPFSRDPGFSALRHDEHDGESISEVS